jgi:hypothetical protein
MAQCITCGTELHPDRALKYDYCLAPECQEKNFKGLTMVAVGMNKAAEELMILDDRTQAELASGKYRDQRRGNFGPPPTTPTTITPASTTPSPSQRPRPAPGSATRAAPPATPASPRTRARTPAPVRKPWTRSQEKLALLYNEQGLRPAEIAGKLGVSPHLVTQIILAARNRGKS